MIVMKFGGTSVQDAEAMKKVLSIAKDYAHEKMLIVASACAGVTSELLSLASESVHLSDDDRIARITSLYNRHVDIASLLGILERVQPQLQVFRDGLLDACEGIALLGECTPRSYDGIASYGELFSTVILHALLSEQLNCSWLDARLVMKTDSSHRQAGILIPETELKMREIVQSQFQTHDILITQGFIASDNEGNTTTLGRGGSDYSAALFGAMLDAQKIVIWTDVSGIATADPRIIPDARFIKRMSFEEARMISYFGAKVLHPETIIPALNKDIPVHVKNTFNPSEEGTIITRMGDESASGFRSVIGKNIVTCIRLNGIVGMQFPKELSEQIFQLTGHIPLLESGVGESIAYVYDFPMKRIAHFLNSHKSKQYIQVDEYALISAIGPDILASHSKDAVHAFYNVIIQHESQPVFISGVQANTLSALVRPGNEETIVKELHAYCSC